MLTLVSFGLLWSLNPDQPEVRHPSLGEKAFIGAR